MKIILIISILILSNANAEQTKNKENKIFQETIKKISNLPNNIKFPEKCTMEIEIEKNGLIKNIKMIKCKNLISQKRALNVIRKLIPMPTIKNNKEFNSFKKIKIGFE